MCEAKWPRPELVAVVDEVDPNKTAETLAKLEEAAEHCPACIVSAWRQANPRTEIETNWNDNEGFTDSMEVPVWLEFDYKAKSAEYMKSKRDEENSYVTPWDL